MAEQRIRKIQIACIAAIGFIIGLAAGYSIGYAAAIDKLVGIGIQYLDIEIKPEMVQVIKAWLIGKT